MPHPIQHIAAALKCLGSIVALITACSSPTASEVPSNAVRWSPPARYALWWRMTEACSARTGDFKAVQWYIVPGSTIELDGNRVQGYWTVASNSIVLADAHRLSGTLIRHEMLHALLRASRHPRDAFLKACDGIVACDGACATETGGREAPPNLAPELLPRDAGTRFEIAPTKPAESLDSGAVAVIVSVTNPRAEPVWLRLRPQAPGDPFSRTFGVAVDYDDPERLNSSTYIWIEGVRFPLGPRETRRFVWDGQLPAGRYGIRGYFNVDTAPRLVIGIGP